MALLLLLCVGLWIPRLQGPLDMRWDGGVYYILATSLAEGRGYRLLNEPGEIEAIQYPPLLPLLAAAYQRAAATSDPAVVGHALRWTFALVFTAYVLAAYLLARRFLTPGWALVAGVVTLLQINTSWLSDLLYAEIPYGLVTLLFFLVAIRGSGSPTRAHVEVVAGLLATAAFLLRTAGVTLLAAWVGESVLRRRIREAAVRLTVALVPVLAWQAFSARVQTDETYTHPAYAYQRAGYQYYNVGYAENLRYVDPFVPERGTLSGKGLAARVAVNLAGIPAALGEAVSSRLEWSQDWMRKLEARVPSVPHVPPWVVYLPPVLFGAIVAWGLVLLPRRGEILMPLYAAATLAVVCVTPWPEQLERYLVPLTPVFATALCLALAAARERLRRTGAGRWRRAGLALTVAVPALVITQESLVAGLVYGRQLREVSYEYPTGRKGTYRLFFYTEGWRLHDQALAWLAPRVHPEQVVATSTPHWFYLKAGRKAVLPPFEPDPAVADHLLESVPVEYLVVDSLEFLDVARRYAAPVARTFPSRWELIYSTPNGASRIYRRREGVEGPGSAEPGPPADRGAAAR